MKAAARLGTLLGCSYYSPTGLPATHLGAARTSGRGKRSGSLPALSLARVLGSFLLLIGVSGSPCACLAQDRIVRTNETSIEAQVLEVRGTQIFYKPWAQRGGPTSVIGTDYVQYILYQDGRRQVFDHPALPAGDAPETRVNTEKM